MINQPPIVAGQLGQVLATITANPGILNIELNIEHGFTEAAARICGLKDIGFNIISTIEPEVFYRGRTWRKVARYSLGSPAWPRPGFAGLIGNLAESLEPTD
jgi:hypothetical protein